MNQLIKKGIIGIVVCTIALMIPGLAISANSPKTIVAKVVMSDGTSMIPSADITIVVTDGNSQSATYTGGSDADGIITGYEETQGLIQIQMANFTAQWSSGDTLTIEVTESGSNETGTTSTTLDGEPSQYFTTDSNLSFQTAAGPVDTTPPVITLTGSATVSICVGDTYTDEGATASDNVDGDITANITTVNPVDTSTPGDYTITYNVSDAAGNAATEVIRTVTVNATCDTTAPVITLTGEATVNVCQNATYTDAGATASDDTDGDITANITTVNPVDTATLGTYTVTYNVSDAAGNAATEVTRTVIVEDCTIDTTAPVITLTGSATVNVCLNETYTDAGATASDTKDGDITANITTVNPVDTTTAATYTVTYNVSDAAGNAATEVTRTVVVAECVTGLAGDADEDGEVKIFDALLVARYVAGLATADEINLENANVDCEAGVTINDALRIAEYDAGLITEFTCP